MPSRAEVKKYRPKRIDGWRLCDDLTDGKCTCRLNSRGPCSAIFWTFQHCYAFNIPDVLSYERDRMRRCVRA